MRIGRGDEGAESGEGVLVVVGDELDGDWKDTGSRVRVERLDRKFVSHIVSASGIRSRGWSCGGIGRGRKGG